MIPAPLDFPDGVALNYGPIALTEHSTLLTVYNETYRNLDLLQSINSLDEVTWQLTLWFMVAVGSVLYFGAKKFSWLQALAVVLNRHFDVSYGRRFRINVALFLAASFLLFAAFCNTINANAVTRTKTTVFDTLDDAIESRDYVPIWFRSLFSAKLFHKLDKTYVEVLQKLREKGFEKKFVQVSDYKRLVKSVQKEKRVLVAMSRMIKLIESHLSLRLEGNEKSYVSNEKFDQSHVAYVFSKQMDTRTRRVFSKLQTTLFDRGMTMKMFDMILDDFSRVLNAISFDDDEGKKVDDQTPDASEMMSNVKAISIERSTKLFTESAGGILWAVVSLAAELVYVVFKRLRLFRKLRRKVRRCCKRIRSMISGA